MTFSVTEEDISPSFSESESFLLGKTGLVALFWTRCGLPSGTTAPLLFEGQEGCILASMFARTVRHIGFGPIGLDEWWKGGQHEEKKKAGSDAAAATKDMKDMLMGGLAAVFGS